MGLGESTPRWLNLRVTAEVASALRAGRSTAASISLQGLIDDLGLNLELRRAQNHPAMQRWLRAVLPDGADETTIRRRLALSRAVELITLGAPETTSWSTQFRGWTIAGPR